MVKMRADPVPAVGPRRVYPPSPRILPSFFLGGFECSTHVLRSGKRLDLIASTRHEGLAAEDYRRLRSIGMSAARDGLRWHVIEPSPGRYDFTSARLMIRAALEERVQVIWDLLHFGWPDHVDVFHPDFPKRLEAFAHRFALVLRDEGDPTPMIAPVNEISFLSFAGGQAGFFNPFAHERGDDMKAQLVRGALLAGRAIRAVHPHARLLHTDPIIHVAARPDRPEDRRPAADHEGAQYQSWDMIAGRVRPELGGSPDMLDLLGANYYVHNQWFFPGGHGSVVPPSSPHYRLLRHMLLDVYRRYRRPFLIAETGIEDEARPGWLAYVARETREAMRVGADLHGICLYPILNHPGWDDDRHCYNGLWDYADEFGDREAYAPLVAELDRQADRMENLDNPALDGQDVAPPLSSFDPVAQEVSEVTERSREGEASP